MKTIVRTYFRDGSELSSSPCIAESGFDSVHALRSTLRERLSVNDDVTDIDGGVALQPKPHRRRDCMYGRMTVVLMENHNDIN